MYVSDFVFFFYLYSARMVLFLAFLYRFYDEILKQKPNTSLLNKYNVIRWNIMSMRVQNNEQICAWIVDTFIFIKS